MRRFKFITIAIVAFALALVVTDRVAGYVWERKVFETYDALNEKRVVPLAVSPDHIVLRDDGATVLVFEPPILYWSAHLNQRAAMQATYAIEIGRDPGTNQPRIKMLQELD